jgi:hypothetical protein
MSIYYSSCQLTKARLWLYRASVGLIFNASTAWAAVIAHTYTTPLVVNTLYREGSTIRTIVDGKLYEFASRRAPFAFDFDGNGAVDVTIGGSGRSDVTSYMYVTQHGRNQVWALAGGAGGLDVGSHALALLAGSTLGPALTSDVAVIGWHNNDDTLGSSILMQADLGRPVSGTFFPATLFELKYLGFRFEGPAGLHYGWMALSAYGFLGEEINVYSWAYESEPDKALVVGQIPEPGVPALLALALWLGIKRGRDGERGQQETLKARPL